MAGATLTTTAAKNAAKQKAKAAPLSGQAISGNHPNWYGPQKAKAAPLSGQAISGNHPNWYGPSARGGSSTQTGAAASPTNASGTTSAAAAPPANQPVQPFLTDAQKAALGAWNTKYGDTLAQLDENDTLAQGKYDQGIATDQLGHDNNTDIANQNMAARGLFQSSIRDNALNDLNVTLAQQKLALQTARDATLFADQNQRNTLAAQNTAEQMTYTTDAVANAQAITPTAQPAGQAGTATGGAQAPHQAQPTAPKPPTPSGPPKAQQPTMHIGPPGASFQQTSASTGPPKAPKTTNAFGIRTKW